ncbi:MAG: hypothetical protein V3T86_05560 [Planctomycetota bacterium]
MLNRWVISFALLAAPLLAQQPQKENLWDAPKADTLGAEATLGWRARFAESLHRVREGIHEDPMDVRAWERGGELSRVLARDPEFIDQLGKAIEKHEPAGAKRVLLNRCLAHALVLSADDTGSAFIRARGGPFVIRFNNANNPIPMLKRAVPLLRAAIEHDAKDTRSKSDLADALETLGDRGDDDENEHRAEITRLTTEVEAAQPSRSSAALPEGAQTDAVADGLRGEAAATEAPKGTGVAPDHAVAEALRKKALVMDICTHTIPFTYEEALFARVALFADDDAVRINLTRTYKDQEGELQRVPPEFHSAGEERRVTLVRELGELDGAAPAAALLAILRGATVETPTSEAAFRALSAKERPIVDKHLAQLLRHALTTSGWDDHFGHFGIRYLVHLAAKRKVPGATPALLEALRSEAELTCPLDAATALAQLGDRDAVGTLLEIANDAERDAYFRRAAVDAIAALAPERVAEVTSAPEIELSLTAAAYRAATDEEHRAAIKARLFRALDDELMCGEAAMHCARLGLADALPAIKEAAKARAGDPPADLLKEALKRIRSAS